MSTGVRPFARRAPPGPQFLVTSVVSPHPALRNLCALVVRSPRVPGVPGALETALSSFGEGPKQAVQHWRE